MHSGLASAGNLYSSGRCEVLAHLLPRAACVFADLGGIWAGDGTDGLFPTWGPGFRSTCAWEGIIPLVACVVTTPSCTSESRGLSEYHLPALYSGEGRLSSETSDGVHRLGQGGSTVLSTVSDGFLALPLVKGKGR